MSSLFSRINWSHLNRYCALWRGLIFLYSRNASCELLTAASTSDASFVGHSIHAFPVPGSVGCQPRYSRAADVTDQRLETSFQT